MEATGYDCPRCGSRVERFDQYVGCRLSCSGCGLTFQGFMSRFYLKLRGFVDRRLGL
jgi:hypothetical protein